jgi:hypothetical protein
VEENDEIPRSPIENPIESPSVVATQLAELTFDLGAVGKRQVRMGGCKEIDPRDLVVNHDLMPHRKVLDEGVDRL